MGSCLLTVKRNTIRRYGLICICTQVWPNDGTVLGLRNHPIHMCSSFVHFASAIQLRIKSEPLNNLLCAAHIGENNGHLIYPACCACSVFTNMHFMHSRHVHSFSIVMSCVLRIDFRSTRPTQRNSGKKEEKTTIVTYKGPYKATKKTQSTTTGSKPFV